MQLMLVERTGLAVAGSSALVAGAGVALLGVGETLRRVGLGRRAA
ncbi:MAG TPA: hypothetical protein VEY87_00200 [Gaiellaceae bacterium]|nr:hypothetical protein [Gaiellaceae bacterium]